jgi:hypothetical protein
MRRTASMSVVAILAAALAGCDDATPPPPPTVAPQPVVPPEPAAPTTQELLTGPRHDIPLVEMPIVLTAPVSWSMRSLTDATSLIVLGGPAPSGDVAIRLGKLNSITNEMVEPYIRGIRDRSGRLDAGTLAFDVRELDGLRLIETVQPEYGGFVAWKVRLLLPQGKTHDQYELSFFGLTREQYDRDAEFLRAILHTARPTEVPVGPATTTAPAAP